MCVNFFVFDFHLAFHRCMFRFNLNRIISLKCRYTKQPKYPHLPCIYKQYQYMHTIRIRIYTDTRAHEETLPFFHFITLHSVFISILVRTHFYCVQRRLCRYRENLSILHMHKSSYVYDVQLQRTYVIPIWKLRMCMRVDRPYSEIFFVWVLLLIHFVIFWFWFACSDRPTDDTFCNDHTLLMRFVNCE